MSKYFTYLFLLLTSIHYSAAQDQHNIDSLQNEISKFDAKKGNSSSSLTDSSKANLLYQISKLYWDSNPDKSMVFAEQSLELS